MRRMVVALGGNAITVASQRGTWEEAVVNMEAVCSSLAALAKDGNELILTHGNGPQVGSLLIQQEAAKVQVPELPMSALGAMTEGWIGFLIEQELTKAMARLGVHRVVLPIITRVLVSRRDTSFRNPTKPVGPYYSENEARLLKKQKGWVMGHDPRRGGWRRLVPSPIPLELVEGAAIQRLVDSGLGAWAVLVASGGGGIPVVMRSDGKLEGIDAVIDKDRTAALLARVTNSDTLAIITDVPNVCVGFNSLKEKPLGRVHARELKRFLSDGEFGEGSMRPKVEAGLSFLEHGGRRAIVTDPASLRRALRSEAGTIIES